MRPDDLPLDTSKLLEEARWMTSLARHLATSAMSPEDLVQETWVAFLTRPPREEAASGSWLHTVLRNFAFRSRRSEARRRTHEEAAARLEVHSTSGGDFLERAEILQQISQRVLRLEEPYRSTVLLRYFEELSPADIARRQGVPVNTVYTRLRRAIEELRTQLDRAHGGDRKAWLTLLLPLVGTSVTAAGSIAAAASTTPAVPATSALGKLFLGGIPLAAKKTSVAFALSVGLLLTVGGLFLWIQAPSGERPETGGDASTLARREPRAPGSADLKAPPSAPGTEVADAGPAVLEIPLAAGLPALRGRIVDSRGQGIAGAHIVALHLRPWETLVEEGRSALATRNNGDLTDEVLSLLFRLRPAYAGSPRTLSLADGGYQFEALPDGEHRLVAWREGYLPGPEAIVLLESPRPSVCDIELAEAQAIRGRVVDEGGKPLPGALVRSLPASWRRLDDSERRDELLEGLRQGRLAVESFSCTAGKDDGSFLLSSLEPGLHDLAVVKPDFGRATRIDVPAGGPELEVVLARGDLVKGVVVDPGHKLLEGVWVKLSVRASTLRQATAVGESAEATLDPEALLHGEDRELGSYTDARGRFEIAGVEPGAWRLTLSAQGSPALVKDFDLPGEGDLGVLVLESPRAIAGVVLAPGGLPAARVRVWIEAAPREGISGWGGRFFDPGALVEAVTSVDGRFRLEGLAEGSYTLHVASAAWVERTLPGIRAGKDDLEIGLAEGRTTSGRVVDGASGAPVPGASVVLVRGLEDLPVPEKRTESAADGAFELRGLWGNDNRLAIEVTHPEYPGGPESAEIKDGAFGDVLTVRLFPAERITGRAIDLEGRPVSSARVTCSLPGSSPVRSAEDGTFVLRVTRKARNLGWLEVAAEQAGRGSGRAAVTRPAEGQGWPDLEIILRPGSVLQGKVLDAKGQAVASATLCARRLPEGDMQGRGPAVSVHSAADGSYRFARLESGVYELEVRAIGHARRVLPRVEVEDTPSVQDLVLEEGKSIEGLVVDEAGRPVKDADVVALETLDLDSSTDFGTSPARWRRRHEQSGVATARTDAAGRYVLRDLPAAGLTLVARARGHEPSPLEVLPPGEEPPDLAVTALGSLAGVVVDELTGEPLSPLTVWLARKEKDEGPESRGGKSFLPREYDDPAGRFQFEALPAGRYAVVVIVPGRPVAGEWADVRSGEENALRLRLEAGKMLTGSVRNAQSGAGIAGARVFCFQSDGGWGKHLTLPTPHKARTGTDGAFVIEGLGPGKYHVHVHHRAYSEVRKSLRVEPGDRDPEPLVVTLRAAGNVEGRIANLSKRNRIWSHLLFRRVDEPGHGDELRPFEHGKDEFHFEALPPGRYEVYLREQVLGPSVSPEATAFKAEDMVERTTHLGEVEVRAGETARFEASVAPEERAR